jgi:hypothetical protein
MWREGKRRDNACTPLETKLVKYGTFTRDDLMDLAQDAQGTPVSFSVCLGELPRLLMQLR